MTHPSVHEAVLAVASALAPSWRWRRHGGGRLRAAERRGRLSCRPWAGQLRRRDVRLRRRQARCSALSAVAVSPDGSERVRRRRRRRHQRREKLRRRGGPQARPRRRAAITETGCLSSDGTDGRDGASGACTPEPLAARGRRRGRQPRRLDGVRQLEQLRQRGRLLPRPGDRRADAARLLAGHAAAGLAVRGGQPVAPARAAPVVSADGSSLYVAAPLEGARLDPRSAASRAHVRRHRCRRAGATRAPARAPPGRRSRRRAARPRTADVAPPRALASIFSASVARRNFCQPLHRRQRARRRVLGRHGHAGSRLARAEPGRQAAVRRGAGQQGDRRVRSGRLPGRSSETGCVKVDAPPGLCSSAKLMYEPTALAISPDGRERLRGRCRINGQRLRRGRRRRARP